jgi:GrpB-like predicted nucleotidyltransferase (UPF0157 family)
MVLGMPGGQVWLRNAHEAWAGQYELERTHILKAIGEHILDIQHVGSTAIPGVPAKPILDILVGVESFEEARVCVDPMEAIGYRYKGENGIPRRHYFVKGDPRTHHVHMVEKDSKDWRVTFLFRDFLRTHSDAAREYAEVKQRLAAQFAADRVSYQQQKDRIVERILGTAIALRSSGCADGGDGDMMP